MNGADLFFGFFAVLAMITGWRVFRTDSMVRASFFLLTSFLAVGGILLLLAAEYLGFALVFMMAVEMTVMALFMVAFFRVRAGLNWVWSLGLTAAGIAFICFLAGMLNRDFPPGLLQSYVDLPWPLT